MLQRGSVAFRTPEFKHVNLDRSTLLLNNSDRPTPTSPKILPGNVLSEQSIALEERQDKINCPNPSFAAD